MVSFGDVPKHDRTYCSYEKEGNHQHTHTSFTFRSMNFFDLRKRIP